MLLRVSTTIILSFLLVPAIFGQHVSSNAPISFGNPRAENRVEVFYDLQCPSCVKFHEGLKNIRERFPDKVFVVIRHFPLPMHNNAFTASTVAEAAQRQGKGLEMAGLLLESQSRWSTLEDPFPKMFGYAKQLGLDLERFRADLLDDGVARIILLDLHRGKSLGVNATPSAFLNGKLLGFADTFDLENVISKGN